jgi:NAD(P)-dependent dehydrogenase (short-subunit alcohol dehydrogenase family)
VKGYAQSAPFAMGKFALRGLAQSMARELSPQGIHVAHVVIDGGIRSARRPEAPDRPDATLDPDAIAATYGHPEFASAYRGGINPPALDSPATARDDIEAADASGAGHNRPSADGWRIVLERQVR